MFVLFTDRSRPQHVWGRRKNTKASGCNTHNLAGWAELPIETVEVYLHTAATWLHTQKQQQHHSKGLICPRQNLPLSRLMPSCTGMRPKTRAARGRVGTFVLERGRGGEAERGSSGLVWSGLRHLHAQTDARWGQTSANFSIERGKKSLTSLRSL